MSDHINIGDTVDVTHATGTGFATWRGEVLDIVGDDARAWVQCITRGPGLSPGERTVVPQQALTRAGDPNGMREDGCDDVDVTGRVRPMHRHAATGEAHAHPGGGTAHTHQTPEQATNGLVRPLVSGEGGADMTPVVTRFQLPLPKPLYDFHVAREQHHAEVEAIEAGDLVGTDSLTVFAVLRDIADNEPLSELIDAAGTGETVGMLCVCCHAESLFDASLTQLEQRVPHLISCPWRRVVEIVGRPPSEPALAATDELVDAEIVCGIGHPVIRGRECDRPEGHDGPHASSLIQWEPTAPLVVCRCGHLESAHETQGLRACSYRDGCGCQLFTDRAATDA